MIVDIVSVSNVGGFYALSARQNKPHISHINQTLTILQPEVAK